MVKSSSSRNDYSEGYNCRKSFIEFNMNKTVGDVGGCLLYTSEAADA